ncbi:MAG: molybdopterin-dependent oxidoreductase [Rhodobacter sp.]|nr:molybdopterin-dependent oxidoreductase [Rhodobacter sp.]
MAIETDTKLTSSHWGVGVVRTRNGRIRTVEDYSGEPDASHLNGNIAASLNGDARVLRPAVRSGWRDGSACERGRDRFVEVSWDEALDLIAGELTRVRRDHGNRAIFAGSYGWASAGRFHHAQSQLKRFLNTIGGFVRSEGNYSYNAALVAMPHIVGDGFRRHVAEATRWPVISKHTELMLLFGGLPMRNTQVSDGGMSRHRMAGNLAECVRNGVRFVNVSPLRTDVDAGLGAEWLAPRPGSDTAIMLGLAHTVLENGLHDEEFLARYTVGFDRVAAYLSGETDGVRKSAEWAGKISGLSPDRLRALAMDMASKRTMISCVAGLQRADWGEQPLWACVTLAAMLGQIGLPGGGYTIGYGVNGHIGNIARPFRWGAFPQGENPIKDFIPVAMISDMLLNPKGSYRYNGQTRVFPDARLVWWAGGNPFHHHQDLNRLRQAFQRPETILVNELNWTATARHADIVLPVAAAPERTDIGGGQSDNILVPMRKAVEPPGDARVEYEIYTALSKRLGTFDAFTEGRDQQGWLRHLWAQTQDAADAFGARLPDWDSFIAGDIVEVPDPAPGQVFLSDFRADPVANPRPTPSGRLELFSDTVARFGLPDCPGHATWNVPRDQAEGRFPLALLSGQPATRLHSQFDNGAVSVAQKVAGREPVLVNPRDAKTRAIADGDVVELFNDRGRCLAGARVTDDVMPGVVFLWTGAWYDPDFGAPGHRDRHGNPNVLTHDLRTSDFSQSPASHSAQVDIRRFDGPVPAVRAFDPPEFTTEDPVGGV